MFVLHVITHSVTLDDIVSFFSVGINESILMNYYFQPLWHLNMKGKTLFTTIRNKPRMSMP